MPFFLSFWNKWNISILYIANKPRKIFEGAQKLLKKGYVSVCFDHTLYNNSLSFLMVSRKFVMKVIYSTCFVYVFLRAYSQCNILHANFCLLMFHKKETSSKVLSFDQFSNYNSIETIPPATQKNIIHVSMYEFD